MSSRAPGPAEPRIAVLARRGRLTVAEPVFERGGGRVALEGRARGDAQPGDLVLLGRGKRGVRVVRRVGRASVTRDVLEGLMLERGLRRRFPTGVESEAAEVSHSPARGMDAVGRADLRALPTLTIDPTSARDFDDAISAEALGDRVRVWVHIADVSAYVRPGTALEKETLRRATSVYVPGAVEPMLPETLSNTACSLVPGEDRLAVSVELELDGAEVRSAAFTRSLIRSDARLTYDQVDAVFAGAERAADPWGEPLALARRVAAELTLRREQRGALAIESSSEPAFGFDAAGRVESVARERQTESHRLIEALMILANEQVAGLLSDRRLATLYRVHERPDPAAVEALVGKLASLSVPTPPMPRSIAPQQAAELVGEISVMVAEHVRSNGGRGAAAFTSLVLRSLKQAYYSPRNLGHTGLQSTRYCHFTSPIRRYPDLVAHRALLAAIGADDVAPRADALEEAAAWSSQVERDAMRIERSADDICLAFLLERSLAERAHDDRDFNGEVVGLIGSGAFIRFGAEGFEGFLPVRRMQGYWTLNEQETILSTGSPGGTLRLGDPVAVRVDRVEPLRGRTDLVLAEDRRVA
ncbi:MAG: RNB domain-containing ribonuclease [Thermoleophilaceae bacterium]|nr:RNB domain-containing ribonuclease [Thermoleophilaceae bacterium]